MIIDEKLPELSSNNCLVPFHLASAATHRNRLTSYDNIYGGLPNRLTVNNIHDNNIHVLIQGNRPDK